MLLSLDVASANTPNIKEHQTRTKPKKNKPNYKNQSCQKRGVNSRESSVAAPFFFHCQLNPVVRSTAAASQGWWICFTHPMITLEIERGDLHLKLGSRNRESMWIWKQNSAEMKSIWQCAEPSCCTDIPILRTDATDARTICSLKVPVLVKLYGNYFWLVALPSWHSLEVPG